MNKNFFQIFFFLLGGVVFSQSETQPRSYVAYRSIDSISIDGKATEASWKNTAYSADFIDIEGDKTPKYRTNVKMIWDNNYLYFFAKMEEPHVWATLKQRDTVIFYNNDFEIFIDPDGDTHNYMEFEMNALNTIWDLFLVKPYREPAPVIDNWDMKGLISAVNIDGTLNDPSNRDNGWSVEIAIPWNVLMEAASREGIPEGEFWRINFSRVNWDFELDNGIYSRKKDNNGNFLPEYNWVWSPQGVINMHEPEHWGYVYFSPKNAGEKDNFSIPGDEEIKWFLYTLYRKQKSFHSKNGKWAVKIEDLNPAEVSNQEIFPKLENHISGWNISVKSPYTGNLYVIKEDGKLINHPQEK